MVLIIKEIEYYSLFSFKEGAYNKVFISNFFGNKIKAKSIHFIKGIQSN